MSKDIVFVKIIFRKLLKLWPKFFVSLLTKNSRSLIISFLTSWGIFSCDCFWLTKDDLVIAFRRWVNLFGFLVKTFRQLSKTVFYVSRKPLWRNLNLWKKIDNVLQISSEKKDLWQKSFGDNFSSAIHMSRWTIGGKTFFIVKLYLYKVYKHFWMLSEKKLEVLEKKLQQLVKMAIYVSRGSFSGMFSLEKSIVSSFFEEVWVKKSRIRIAKLPTRLSKLHSLRSADNLRKQVYREIYKVLINFGLLANFCEPLAKKIWRGSQKCLLLVQRNNLRKKSSFCKKYLEKIS